MLGSHFRTGEKVLPYCKLEGTLGSEMMWVSAPITESLPSRDITTFLLSSKDSTHPRASFVTGYGPGPVVRDYYPQEGQRQGDGIVGSSQQPS